MVYLVTGGTGFVGKPLIRAIVESGGVVRALLRSQTNDLPTAVETFIVNELSEWTRNEFHETLQRHNVFHGVDVVIHAAGKVHLTSNSEGKSLEEYRQDNCEATMALAKAASDAGVKRFVFLSSIKVNGELSMPGKPFIPESEYIPTDTYGLSKYEAEKRLFELAKNSDLEVVIIRPPLVYGPGVRANFASMVKWIRRGIPLPFGSVQNKRSLIALDNLVSFILLCSDIIKSPLAANQVFLVSDEEVVSTPDLIKRIARAYGKKVLLFRVPVIFMRLVAKLFSKEEIIDRLLGDLQVDNSKSRLLLGWKPVITMDKQLAKMARSIY